MFKKKEFLWNTIGSMVFAVFSAVILMTCTRLNGVEIAGIFSICYATGCILNAIGDLGIRIVQVTDTNRKYGYDDYFFARIVALGVMILLATVFAIVTGYSNEKLFIFVILILIRVLDNFSETFQAEFQLNNRLDLAGKSLLYRNTLELLTFIILNKFVGNIYIAFGGMLLIGTLVLIFYELRNIRKFQNEKFTWRFEKIKVILRESFPLGISTLVSMYVINSVKYAIERMKNNEVQTYFNILYMPTFVLNMISLLIIKPFLKIFGEYWNNGQYTDMKKIIIRLSLVLVVFGALGELVCAFIGIPILNWLYKVDLSKYTVCLLIMVLSGLFYAISTIMFYALGAIRKQRVTTIIYVLASAFAFGISYALVDKKNTIMGATISNLCIMIFLFAGLTGAFVFNYIKMTKKKVK
ncbi:MAG: oligosaccharide flippase family protein [Clostridia bacterium]|nr:oligosaccharide flippase family protein [Clostridia bacterium]